MRSLRFRLIAVAGQLIRTAGQWGLKLAENWAGQANLTRVRQQLAARSP